MPVALHKPPLGFDNGDVKLFDLRTNTVRWEGNVSNGVSTNPNPTRVSVHDVISGLGLQSGSGVAVRVKVGRTSMWNTE